MIGHLGMTAIAMHSKVCFDVNLPLQKANNRWSLLEDFLKMHIIK